MQWTPAAFMQFIPASQEVQVWVAEDESFVTTSNSGAFLRHLRGPGLDNLYRSSALPVHAWTADGTKRYAFGTVGQRALAFRCAMPGYDSTLKLVYDSTLNLTSLC
jgi:hypothetical protein